MIISKVNNTITASLHNYDDFCHEELQKQFLAKLKKNKNFQRHLNMGIQICHRNRKQVTCGKI